MNKSDKPEDLRNFGGRDCENGRDTVVATFVTEPLDSDLLCGIPPDSGHVPSCHQANLRLRTTLQRWEKTYSTAASSGNTARQDKIVQSLFDSLVQSEGLRFLRPVDKGSNEAIELGIPPEITAAWIPMSPSMVRGLIQKQLGKAVNGRISTSTSAEKTGGPNAKEGRTVYSGGASPASRSVLHSSSPKSPLRRPEVALAAASAAYAAATDYEMGHQLLTPRGSKHGHVSAKRSLETMENDKTGSVARRRSIESKTSNEQPLVAFRFPPSKRAGLPPSSSLWLVDDTDKDYTIYSALLHGSKTKRENVLFGFKSFFLPRGLDRLFPGYKSCVMVFSVLKGTQGDKAGIAVGDILCWVDTSSPGRAGKPEASPRRLPSRGRDEKGLFTYKEFQRHLDPWHDSKNCFVYVARMKRDLCDGRVDSKPPASERSVAGDITSTRTPKVSEAAPAPAVAHRNGSQDTIATKETPIHEIEPGIYATLTSTLVLENSSLRTQCQDLINEIEMLQSKQRAAEKSSDELFHSLQNPSSTVSEPSRNKLDGSTRANVPYKTLPDVIPTPPFHRNVWSGIRQYIDTMTEQKAELKELSTTLALDKKVWEASLAKASVERDELQQEYDQLQAHHAEVYNRMKRRRTSVD